MKYQRFEDLPVWQSAIGFAVRVFALTARSCSRGNGDLRGQLERAALSISNNIAEGFERGTTQELLTFLYISRGSAGESRSMLCFIERVPAFADFKSEISDSEIPGGEHFAPAAGMGGVLAEFGHQGYALSD
jgi:four helix bundle protein